MAFLSIFSGDSTRLRNIHVPRQHFVAYIVGILQLYYVLGLFDSPTTDEHKDIPVPFHNFGFDLFYYSLVRMEYFSNSDEFL